MADDTLNGEDGTLSAQAGSLGGCAMRYHELAMQSWLNSWAMLRFGVAVPCVISSPMDALSSFQQLWSQENNPFSYLYALKDSKGTPIYQPYPAPVRYPIISIHRRGWKFRPYQNFSIHRLRHINWPTVASAGTVRYGLHMDGSDVTRADLGNVTTARRPAAWDFKFQVDHFCNRPDTQALFIEQTMQEFWRSGAVPQTWIEVPYPGWGKRRVRLYLDGDIENLTPEEPEEGKNIEYRTSFTVTVEGFDVDLRYEIYPTLWKLILNLRPASPEDLSEIFSLSKTVDIRLNGTNPAMDNRPNVPAWGDSRELLRAAAIAAEAL